MDISDNIKNKERMLRKEQKEIRKEKRKNKEQNLKIENFESNFNNFDEEKKVLILLLSYNRPEKCKRVIENIENQIYKNYKLLIIDDYSEIDNYKIIENFVNIKNNNKIKLLRNDFNMKIPKTINKGLVYFLENNFDYFTWLSDDNIYYENYIKDLLNTNYDFITSSFEYYDEIYNKTSIYKNNYISVNDILNNFKGMTSFMWSRNAIKKIGFFDENLYGIEDYEYEIRTYMFIDKIKFVDKITMKYILNNDSLTIKIPENIINLTKNIKLIYNFILKNIDNNFNIYYQDFCKYENISEIIDNINYHFNIICIYTDKDITKIIKNKLIISKKYISIIHNFNNLKKI